MKRTILIMLLVVMAAASWSEVLLTEPQMRLFSRIRTANSWLGAGLCMEAAGMIGFYASMFSAMDSYYWGMGSENLALMGIFLGAAGAGLLTQLITTTAIGTSSIRLTKSIEREGSNAPKPTGISVWSLLSSGSMAATFLLSALVTYSVSLETYEPLSMLGGLLALTSIVSAGVTYFSVKGYGAEIGWEEYRQAQKAARTDFSNAIPNPALLDSGRLQRRILIPLFSIQY